MRLKRKTHIPTKQSPYPEGSVGRLMEPPLAVFLPTQTVEDAIETLREQVKHAFITYAWVLEADGTLVGVITMRDLLFSPGSHRLADVMLRSVFALEASMPVLDAMKLTLDKHFPVYPVTDREGRLLGTVRGHGARMVIRQAGGPPPDL